jgi:hypothetical protein
MSRCIAGVTCSPSTTTVRLMPLALSESMWTWMSPIAVRAQAIALPPSASPVPTTETMPRLRSTVTSPCSRRSTISASSRDASSIVTDTLTSDVATTSTDVLCARRRRTAGA